MCALKQAAALMERAPQERAREEPPIFIVGANRSGTTLLRLMLNAHSRIAIPDELEYLDATIAGVPVERWRAPTLSDKAFHAFVSQLFEARKTVLDGVDVGALVERVMKGPRDLRYPYEVMLSAWARAHGKPRWGEKTPGNLFYVDVLHAMFPEAQFILVVRDPRAGVTSMQEADFFPRDVVFNALSRRKHHRASREMLRRHLPPSQHLTVRYEDLVAAPEETLRWICSFLGEAFEPTMLSYYRDASEYMTTDAASTFNVAATRPVTTHRVERWRKVLRPREVALVEQVCAEEMRDYGYQAEAGALSLVGWAELITKQAYWLRQQRRNRHIRHYTVRNRFCARLRRRSQRCWESLRRHVYHARTSRASAGSSG